MYKFGKTLQDEGFIELRKEGDAYLFSVGDCFDDGEEGTCMPLFSFSKKVNKEGIGKLIEYLRDKMEE